MKGIVYLNGQWLDFGSAKVGIEDRGFQFGDGVYEVIRFYEGRPFRLEEHLTRLERSAAAIELALPASPAELAALAQEAQARSGIAAAQLYLQVTRGEAPRNHLFPEGISPTFVITVREVRRIPEQARRDGVTAIILPDERWGRCDIKSTNLLPNVLAKEKAHRLGAFDAVFVRDGLITESSSANLFALVGGILRTAPRGRSILGGITRDFVLELASETGLPVKEQSCTLEELYRAPEVFLTGTTVEIVPVVRFGDTAVGNGKPGPAVLHLQDAFARRIKGFTEIPR
ncbi:MAG: D-amino-acid transaminase [Firmicutes bacterium]|nr:D-amino-acid transaminase [Bacillota bacterium]